MTLCAEIQRTLEKTYSNTGINLEDCVIGPTRYGQLSAMTGVTNNLSTHARTFLRWIQGNLHIAIYYSPDLIRNLEQRHPHREVSHHNIASLIAFIEEITHGVHAALAFKTGRFRIHSERFLCDMELLAKIDIYWLLLRFVGLITGLPPTVIVKQWIYARLFEDERFDYTDSRLRKRYRLANQMAQKFIRHIEHLPADERVKQIRSFRQLDFLGRYRLLRRKCSKFKKTIVNRSARAKK